MIRKAMPGTYTVKAKFFGSRSAERIGAVILHVDSETRDGAPRQKEQPLALA